MASDARRSLTKRHHHGLEGPAEANTKRRAVTLASSRLLPAQYLAANEESARANTLIKNTISDNHASITILDLPNELLRSIASRLHGSATLVNLSLVNKRFKDIAQDSMLRKLYIPKCGIRRVLEMLVRIPDNLQKVRYLDFGKRGCRHHGYCQCLGSLKFDARSAHFFCKQIDQNPTHKVTWHQIQQAKSSPKYWYNLAHSLFLNILVAVCPNLKEVAICLPPHRSFAQTIPQTLSENYQYAAVVPFESPTLEVLQRNLEALIIKCDFRCTGNAIHIIRLPGFHNLKSLLMPMNNLGTTKLIEYYRLDPLDDSCLQSTQSTHDDKVACLPMTLTDLHLTSCNKQTFALLYVLNGFKTGLLCLKNITLSFDVSACSALILCAAGRWPESITDRARRWRQRLHSLVSKHYSVQIYTNQSLAICKAGRKASFLEELDAMAILSCSEVAEIARANMQLSDCVARNLIGPRRRKCPLEHQIFVNHGIDHLELFCSPTFNAASWADVVFFHGTRNSTSGQGLQGAVNAENKVSKAKTSSSRLSSLKDLTHSAFSMRIPPRQSPISQSIPTPILSLSALSATLTSSIPRPEVKNRLTVSRKDYARKIVESNLIFNGDIELWKGLYNQRSEFKEILFSKEVWKWYLQPRVEIERNRLVARAELSRKYAVAKSEKRQRR
ncbi:hypothetical protein EJ07DRAFT_157609 [Lizonia empirigonia]|nr:hypothetical protein EJ07DRAFT_157609 [Lizonia empirigonia]